jgi:hypothetical protein
VEAIEAAVVFVATVGADKLGNITFCDCEAKGNHGGNNVDCKNE